MAAQTGTGQVRVPPHDADAERGVLGCILLDCQRVMDLCIERRLTAESFLVPAHRTIFSVLFDLYGSGKMVDLLTLGERLRTLNCEEQVGGRAYVEGLVDAAVTPAHAEHYVDIVRQKHLLRSIIDRSRTAIEACYAGDLEADAILDETEQALYDIAEQQTASEFVSWPVAVKDAMVGIEKAIELRKDITGVPTGFVDLDRITHGLQPGDMIIIAARPSMGKTSLAMNIAENAALGRGPEKKRHSVAVFSLEMSRESLVKRMLCSLGGISSHKLSGGYLSADAHKRLVESAATLNEAKIYVDDSAGLTPVDVRARARRLKRKFGIELVVIDYLQLLNYPQYSRDGRQQETAKISAALKAMAKELKIPVIVLSQLSRAPEQRGGKSAAPKLSDLRDSGSIEQDADVVCMLRRPCKYPEDPEFGDKTLAILDIAKQRNGPTGEIRLNFTDELTRFADRTQMDQGFQPSSGGTE